MLDDEQLIGQLTQAILEAASVRELGLRACLTAPLLPKTLPPLLGLVSASTSLTFLDLTGNCLGDSGVESLAAHGLAKTQVLRALVLDENSITDKGATNLGHSLRQHKQTSLKSLSLALNAIQKAGVQYIASALCSNSTLVRAVLLSCYPGPSTEIPSPLSNSLPSSSSVSPFNFVATCHPLNVIEYHQHID
jgi:Ran GTPase-activating protein (RanGAP) involved in mRNA processing and transport